MFVRFKTLSDATIYVNPFTVQTVEKENYTESRITFSIGEYSEIVVKGDLETAVTRINNEAERMLKKLGIGSVENLTIN